jgi:hypothetical protein
LVLTLKKREEVRREEDRRGEERRGEKRNARLNKTAC